MPSIGDICVTPGASVGLAVKEGTGVSDAVFVGKMVEGCVANTDLTGVKVRSGVFERKTLLDEDGGVIFPSTVRHPNNTVALITSKNIWNLYTIY